MRESTKKKWASMAGVFMAVFGSFAALMYLSVRTFETQQTRPTSAFFRFQERNPTADLPAYDVSDFDRSVPSPKVPKKKHVLWMNQQRKIGGIVVTYRGLEGRSAFRLDSVIPDLDRNYTYVRRVDIAAARKGFRVGGERFTLLSVGRSKIRIIHHIHQ